jgi:hypothetical protein
LPWSSDNLLDFIRLQQTRQICSGHDGLRQVVVALQLGLHAPSTVEGVQALESRLSPDAETTNMTTRSKLHEVQFVNRNHGNSGDVTESLGQTLVLAIDDQRSQLASTAAIAHLTLTCAETPGLVNLQEIKVDLDNVYLTKRHSLLLKVRSEL